MGPAFGYRIHKILTDNGIQSGVLAKADPIF
jgi:hypothetical protein